MWSKATELHKYLKCEPAQAINQTINNELTQFKQEFYHFCSKNWTPQSGAWSQPALLNLLQISSSVEILFCVFSLVLIFFNSFSIFFIGLFYSQANSDFRAAQNYSLLNSTQSISTETAASPTAVKMGREMISFSFWRHTFWRQTLSRLSFFLYVFTTTGGAKFLQELWGLVGSARITPGMPSAGHRQRASRQPTLSLQAVCTPSPLWQYDERNTFTLIMSPGFSKDSPFLLSLSS